LAKRLSRRGVTLSGALVVAELTPQWGSAAAPLWLLRSTILASLVPGGPRTTDGVSGSAADLTKGVLASMMASKFKSALAPVTTCLAIGLGAWFVVGGTRINAQQGAAQGEVKPIVRAIPNLAGTWQGKAWGNVTLKQPKYGIVEGAYSETFNNTVG